MVFFPKKIDFFDVFNKVTSNVSTAASLFVSLMESFDNIDARSKEIFELEQDSDILTHEILKKLNSSYLTSLDREDIHDLAIKLDDILDLIWAATDRLTVFKLKEPTKEAIKMSKGLLEITDLVCEAVKKLEGKNYITIKEYCIEINTLENKMDRYFKYALETLFDEIKDPVLIIQWKDIYDRIEYAADKCEDVADVLETIVLKHT
jgi:predicted phosphate transport protein (TIGR00153 family)